jgi:hypothetical protein
LHEFEQAAAWMIDGLAVAARHILLVVVIFVVYSPADLGILLPQGVVELAQAIDLGFALTLTMLTDGATAPVSAG